MDHRAVHAPGSRPLTWWGSLPTCPLVPARDRGCVPRLCPSSGACRPGEAAAPLWHARTVLAYLFWHRPGDDVDRADYEARLRRFHGSLAVRSASFRLRRLPFAEVQGYEDWYLVEDWAALGALNASAVDSLHRGPHDAVAHLAAEGWGGVYAHLRGPVEPPARAGWRSKPAGRSYGEFLATLPATTIWQRQMVLGPAPEFCIGQGDPAGRQRLF
jgi:hypothetical protein